MLEDDGAYNGAGNLLKGAWVKLKKSGEIRDKGVKIEGTRIVLNDKVGKREEIRITMIFLVYRSTWVVVPFTKMGRTEGI